MISKLLFGLDVYFKPFGNTTYPYITHKFFDDNNVEIVKDFSLSTDIFSFMKSINNDILLLVDDLVKFGYCDELSFKEDMNTILRIINSKGLTYSIKPHPYNTKLYGGMQNEKNILPSFIPANCFVSISKWKYIIGLITTTVLDSQNQSDTKVICLIDCLKWKSEIDKKNTKDWLSKNNERILFPKDWNEFEKIIKYG